MNLRQPELLVFAPPQKKNALLDGYTYFCLFCPAILCTARKIRIVKMNRNREHANYNDKIGITYKCEKGHSFSATNASDTQRTVHCQANGMMERLERLSCQGKGIIVFITPSKGICPNICEHLSHTKTNNRKSKYFRTCAW